MIFPHLEFEHPWQVTVRIMAPPAPISDHLQRCLLFVKLANDGGGYPSINQLDEYARHSEPQPPGRTDVMATIYASITQLNTELRDGRPVAAYMQRLGWLTSQHSGLKLTALGHALISGLVASPTTSPDRAIVLSPTDPARYEVLVRSMAAAGHGLLADPYLKPEFFDLLVTGTSLTRLLLSTGVNRTDRKLISLALHRLSTEHTDDLPQVRISSDRRFHDRYLLHQNGAVDLIGASVNSLDTRVTALVPIPDPATPAITKYLESLWAEAEEIKPTPPRTARPSVPDQDDPKPAD